MVDNANIASTFAEFFSKACSCNSYERSSQHKHECDELHNGYIGSTFTDEYLFDVQLVDSIVRQLKCDKSPGKASPLFGIYIDDVAKKVSVCASCCHLSLLSASICCYADDMLLILRLLNRCTLYYICVQMNLFI